MFETPGQTIHPSTLTAPGRRHTLPSRRASADREREAARRLLEGPLRSTAAVVRGFLAMEGVAAQLTVLTEEVPGMRFELPLTDPALRAGVSLTWAGAKGWETTTFLTVPGAKGAGPTTQVTSQLGPVDRAQLEQRLMVCVQNEMTWGTVQLSERAI